MWYVEKPNELYHYGVKGMKWGHHKWKHSSGAASANLNSKNYGMYVNARVAQSTQYINDYNENKERVEKSEYRDEIIKGYMADRRNQAAWLQEQSRYRVNQINSNIITKTANKIKNWLTKTISSLFK